MVLRRAIEMLSTLHTSMDIYEVKLLHIWITIRISIYVVNLHLESGSIANIKREMVE